MLVGVLVEVVQVKLRVAGPHTPSRGLLCVRVAP